MGLAARRVIKELQENQYPKLLASITEACGFEPILEVDWDLWADDKMVHLASDSILKVFFQPVAEALKEISSDEMGAEALKNSLKKIVFSNKNGAFSPAKAITFEDGILSVDHEPYSNMDDIKDRKKFLINLLENNL